MKIKLEYDTRAIRRSEYPEVGDQLDAIFKMAVALNDQGIKLPEETISWINKIQSIKNKIV